MSILTTFVASSIFKAAGAVEKINSSKLSLPKSVKHTVLNQFVTKNLYTNTHGNLNLVWDFNLFNNECKILLYSPALLGKNPM